jgi:hypothetical protein
MMRYSMGSDQSYTLIPGRRAGKHREIKPFAWQPSGVGKRAKRNLEGEQRLLNW